MNRLINLKMRRATASCSSMRVASDMRAELSFSASPSVLASAAHGLNALKPLVLSHRC
jgi:hypothetical protein